MDYIEFFQQATISQDCPKGVTPYPCQQRFAGHTSSEVALRLPTGVGKTLTVLVAWLFRQQYGQAATRLVIIEPMRTLVSQVIERVRATVAASQMNHVGVLQMMGGAIEQDWVKFPERPCVIVGTQDQILSRQLNRGYACSRWAWPMHFALLNNDCEFFIDECQLMGPGYSTTIDLVSLRNKLGVFGACRTIWSSATLDMARIQEFEDEFHVSEVNLAEDDYEHPVLSAKLTRQKHLHRLDLKLDNYISQLGLRVLEIHSPNTLTLVIVNQVRRAIELYRALSDSGIPLLLLHSRFRRCDRERQVDQLQDSQGNDFKGIVISTQVVEAGVDLDARNLITEVASWSSMVQRFGRCGRNGTYAKADIYWVSGEGWPHTTLLPYEAEDLKLCRQKLAELDGNASIQSLLAIEPPPQKNEGRSLTQDKLLDLFDNFPLPDGRDIDIADYIRSASAPPVHVAWLDLSDSEPDGGWEPTEDELCPVPICTFKRFSKYGWIWDGFNQCWSKGVVTAGSVVVLPILAGGYSAELGFTGISSDIPQPLTVSDSGRQEYQYERRAYRIATQAEHGSGQVEQMQRLRSELSQLELPEWLDKVALHSDLGKSHPVWQLSATGTENPTVKLAKSPHLKRHSRKGFRHEFVSAIAMLQLGMPFKFAYLAAAHHGKVRCNLLAFPWEKADNGRKGVNNDDVLPSTDLGLTLTPELKLNLVKPLWWSGEASDLMDDEGPFRLAFLEALVRAADIADSIEYEREPQVVSDDLKD